MTPWVSKTHNFSPSPNLKLCGQWNDEVIMMNLWGNYDETYVVIMFNTHSIQEKFLENENLA